MLSPLFKIFTASILGVGLLSGLAILLFSPQDKPALAQEQEISLPLIICDEPIPVGEIYEESISLLNDVYREYQLTREYLASAVKETQAAVAELYQNDNICDFSVCFPQIIDQAPDLKIDLSWGFGSKTITNVHIPFCQPKACLGAPCPDLSKYLERLKNLKSSIEGSQRIVHAIFAESSVPVTEEIRIKSGLNPDVGAKITRPQAIERKIKLAREWLSSSAEKGKKTCSLTDAERKKLAEGEIGNRYPQKCVDALAEGLYWPKMWSENCAAVCEKGETEQCAACLGKPVGEGASALAKINFKIFHTCFFSCQKGWNKECRECLCTADDGHPMTDEECIAWFCGGSYYNYVCCHETPLQINSTSEKE